MNKKQRNRAAPLNIEKYNHIVYGIMTQFFMENVPPLKIAEWTVERLKEVHPERKGEITVARERIYQVIKNMVARKKFVTFTPHLHYEIEHALREMFGNTVDMKIANVHADKSTSTHLGSMSAELVLKLIKDSGKDEVHIGLGSGTTVRMFAQQLAFRLAAESEMPKLTFHVMSNGYVKFPMTGPMSFLSYFTDLPNPVDFVGLVSPIAVEWDNYERTKRLVGIHESFDRKDEISIIVTSIASADDKHGLLNCLLNPKNKPEEKWPKPIKDLRRHNVVGDMQFRPYNEQGPLNINTGLRAVTLFELEELSARVTSGDLQSVMICGPCNQCITSKAQALRPLISGIESLRLCSHLVTDIQTARDLQKLGPI